MEPRVCKQCLEAKPVAEFWMADKERGYLRPNCKVCDKAYQRLQYARSAEFRKKARANSKKWAVANPRTPEKQRQYALKGMYGLTLQTYEAMVVSQGGRCALCDTGKTGRDRPDSKWKAGHWNIDHCHETGRVRGLLCHKCNVRIGAYEGLLREIGIHKVVAYLTGSPHDPEPPLSR